jgi:uncharacterized membrane protein YkoI
MGKILTALVTSAGLLAGIRPAPAAEGKVTLESLPAAVQRAVRAQIEGGTLLGVTEERQDGVTVYEVETKVRGRRRDMILDGQGRVLVLEEETGLHQIPASARSAIQKAAGAAKLTLVEKVTRGDKTYYEAHISKGSTVSEVKVDADGKPVE